MSIALLQRVKVLEAKVAELEKLSQQTVTPVSKNVDVVHIEPQVVTSRKMCPKCGVKPNHFFHVRTCTGKQEEQKDATFGPGSNNSA